jgi:ADP-ribose pyrophosphatase YjhB (NUDIX family)
VQRTRIEAVGAVVTDPEGRLLLVLRGREPSAGLWSIPGGKVEAGETLAEAVRREVAEETGLTVEVGAQAGTVERPTTDGGVYVIHDFVATPVGDAVPRAGDDADEAGWFTATEARALDCVPGLLEALEEWGLLPPG